MKDKTTKELLDFLTEDEYDLANNIKLGLISHMPPITGDWENIRKFKNEIKKELARRIDVNN